MWNKYDVMNFFLNRKAIEFLNKNHDETFREQACKHVCEHVLFRNHSQNLE